jgi:hypothetical protein
MTWRQLGTPFALIGFAEAASPRAIELALGPAGGQVIREGGETTLLVPMSALAEVLELHPTARAERDLVGYRFEAAMGWDVVGFLALVTSRLAESGIPVCALCAFSRDYVLIARRYEDGVRRALSELFPEVTGNEDEQHGAGV